MTGVRKLFGKTIPASYACNSINVMIITGQDCIVFFIYCISYEKNLFVGNVSVLNNIF